MYPIRPRRRDWMSRWESPEDSFVRLMNDRWSRIMPFGEEEFGYPVDIREEDGTLHVDAEMPGFTRDQIDVELEDNVLRIVAERKPTEKRGTTHLEERTYTRVERSFTLPRGIDESQAKAHLEDGVLHLEIPRSETAASRRIEVD